MPWPILVLCLFFITPSFAEEAASSSKSRGLFLAVTGGGSYDDGEGFEQSKSTLTYSAQLGFRFGLFALEGVYRKTAFETGKGTTPEYSVLQCEHDLAFIEIGARIFFFKYLSIRAGIASAEGDRDVELTNVAALGGASYSEHGPADYYGTYLGAGLQFPFGGWDFFVDYTIFRLEDMDALASGISAEFNVFDVSGGFRYTF